MKKMGNTRRKGYRIEKQVSEILKQEGYTVYKPYPATTLIEKYGKRIFFTRSNDIFGVFDLIAKKKNSETRWIQITTGLQNKSVRSSKIEEFAKACGNSTDSFELWVKVKSTFRRFKFKRGWREQ